MVEALSFREFSFCKLRSCSRLNFGTRNSRLSWKKRASSSKLFAVQKPQSDVYPDDNHPVWERVNLMERLLQVSITEENYIEAAKLRDTLQTLRPQLTTTEELLLLHTRSLYNDDVARRVQAIEAFGNLGDQRVCPLLTDGLRDEHPRVVMVTEKALWKIFMRSGREDVDKLIKEGVSKMVDKNGLLVARDIFTKVIEMAPSFAEGYNKRATVSYLLQDYRQSIDDCKKTLELNPYHFAALSGMGLCYVAIEDPESAIFWLEKAYAMHPGLVQISKYIKVLKRKIRDKRSKN